ncbi:MAG: ABC transporter permease subunit [Patescibacteria group bacterium]
MNLIWVIAQKEIKDILRSKIFIYSLILLLALTGISTFVSSAVFHDQLLQYQDSIAFLQSIGRDVNTAAPTLFPLNLLRGAVDYVEIIGAILGIFLGYISVSKEKTSKTLPLIFTRPVTEKQVSYGKLLGNLIFIATLCAAITIFIAGVLIFFANAPLNFLEYFKLFLFTILSSVYILIFFALSFWLSARNKVLVNALIFAFVIWIGVVLILPQIGDTMDPDNQVPGGFFKSMGMTKDQELKVMGELGYYEKIRTGVEQLSIAKHYERPAFALFGIKKTYNGMPLLAILNDRKFNFLLIVVVLFLLVELDIRAVRQWKNI